MKNRDVELINQILAGDESAFAGLVKKYEKQVHALAWRKIGDFHIAEEIAQDTFLKVYQKLSTLKDPNQFSGWLYVIATNLCRAWLRKKRLETEPLENTEIASTGAIHLGDTNTGQRKSMLSGHTGVVTNVAFSPDGQIFASGSWDCSVLLWDFASLTKAIDTDF